MKTINEKIKNDVLKALDSLQEECVQIASDTVRIQSINPEYEGVVYDEVVGGETKVNEYYKPIFADMGLETDLWEGQEGRSNLVGLHRGIGKGKSLILNGHVDVVPPGSDEAWTETDPWSGDVKDGRIWGRGSVDMKGGNAAAIIALKAVLKAGYKPKGDVILEMVIGEENGSEVGTWSAIQRGYKADGTIVVEPSMVASYSNKMMLCPASPGVFYMRVTVPGKATHVLCRAEMIRAGGRGDEIGVNSIEKSLIVLEAVKKLEEEWGQTKRHPLFNPGHFTLNPGVITGGPAGAFVISEKSTIDYAIWHHPAEKPSQVKKEIEDQIKRFAQTDRWLRKNPPSIEWLIHIEPYDTPRDALICRAIEDAYTEALNSEPYVHAFPATCDGGLFHRAGMDVVVFGPGDLLKAHAANENIMIQEMLDAARVYALTILQWCGVQ